MINIIIFILSFILGAFIYEFGRLVYRQWLFNADKVPLRVRRKPPRKLKRSTNRRKIAVLVYDLKKAQKVLTEEIERINENDFLYNPEVLERVTEKIREATRILWRYID